MRTKYRTVSLDGHHEFLQYEAEATNLFLRLIGITKQWKNVPRPYFHRKYGRTSLLECLTTVNSRMDSLTMFVSRYPDINDYLKVYEERQAELEAEVAREKLQTRYFD